MEPLLPRTVYRRESLPIGRSPSAQSGRSPNSPVPPESRVSSGLREEDELLRFSSQTSLFSSSSGGMHHSSGKNFFVQIFQFRNKINHLLIFFVQKSVCL